MPKGVYPRTKSGLPKRPSRKRPEKQAPADAAAMEAAAQSAANVAAQTEDKKGAVVVKDKPDAPMQQIPALADLMNAFADMMARTPPGTAQACKVGQSWVGVMEYYFPNVGVNHPVVAAVWATGQFGAAAWVMHGLRKSAEKKDTKDAKPTDAAPALNGSAKKKHKPGDNLFDNVPSI